MRMHATQAAKPISRNPHAFEIGQLDLARIADNHKLDVALAIDKHADLPARLVGKLANLASKFGRYDLVRRNAALVEFLDPPQLVWLQTLCVAVKTFHSVNCRKLYHALVTEPGAVATGSEIQLATSNFATRKILGTKIGLASGRYRSRF